MSKAVRSVVIAALLIALLGAALPWLNLALYALRLAKVVWVLGPSGHQHYYAHRDQFANVSRGDRVKAGTLLGYVGNTGNAWTTPPHLHYGVYADAGAINPFPLLAMQQKSN